MTTYIFDLRRLAKPTHGKPIAAGRQPRPHSETNDRVTAKREAARRGGAIDRVLVHHWGVDVGVHPSLGYSDHGEAVALSCRAAGVDMVGRRYEFGGAPYHISVGATSRGSGVVALVWPREAHTYHASEENRRSIGVGVMGRFERDEEGPARPGLPEAMAWAFHIAAGLVRDPLDDLGAHLDSVTTEPVPAVRGADAWVLRGLPLPMGSPPPMEGPFDISLPGDEPAWVCFEPGARRQTIYGSRESAAAAMGVGPPVLCTTHSQSANKPHDPGLYVVRHGIAPAVRAGWLHVEPGWSTGKGQPWPDAWRQEVRRA